MHCGVMVTGYNQGDWERCASFAFGGGPSRLDGLLTGGVDNG